MSTLLSRLGSPDVENYKSVINLVRTFSKQRKFVFKKIIDFMQYRFNRLDAIETEYQKSDETDNLDAQYSMFTTATRNLYGLGSDDLDRTNGEINNIIYGDVKADKLRLRQLKDLETKQALLQAIVTSLDDIESDLSEVESNLPS